MMLQLINRTELLLRYLGLEQVHPGSCTGCC